MQDKFKGPLLFSERNGIILQMGKLRHKVAKSLKIMLFGDGNSQCCADPVTVTLHLGLPMHLGLTP